MAAGFFVFFDHPVLWPLKVLVVLFHELSHAIATVLTGGEVEAISLSPNQGGLTLSRGGWPFVILNAGYVGSLAWGVALLASARNPRVAAGTVVGLSALLFAVSLVYVRPLISFGMLFSLFAVAALAAISKWASAATQAMVLRGVGTFSILYALIDIRDDVFRAGDGAVSDATMLAAATGIPAFVWGAVWLLAGLGTLWSCRRWLA
jgi:hypothetical protein